MENVEYIEPNQLIRGETYKIYDDYRSGAFESSDYNRRNLPTYNGNDNVGNPMFLVNELGRGVTNKSFNPTHYRFKLIKMGGRKMRKTRKTRKTMKTKNNKKRINKRRRTNRKH
jgi:hypothetical protein